MILARKFAWMPNIGFFKTVFNKNVHIFGQASINPKLDGNYPSYVVRKLLALESPTLVEDRNSYYLREEDWGRLEEVSESEERMKVRLTKNDADILQKFLEAEGKPELHRVLCDICKRYSKSCDNCFIRRQGLAGQMLGK